MGLPVSVIIPCYNSSKTIENTVQSVINQTQIPKEIILIDDCSFDNGKTLDKLYDLQNKLKDVININVISLPSNQGAASARNAGLKAASQVYLAFLDADDVWKPHKLELQMKIFDLYPEAGLVGSNINNNKFNYFYCKKFDEYTEITLLNLIFKNFFPTPTVIIKKEIVDRIGYFNSKQRYAEEGDFFIRIASKYKCILINESLVECGNGKPVFGHSGLSGNLRAMETGELKNLKMAFLSKYISLPIYLVAVLYSIIKYFRRIMITKVRKSFFCKLFQKIKFYGFIDSIFLLVYSIKTKFVFKNARIIRFPIDIRGKSYMEVGRGFTTGKGCRLEAFNNNNNKVLKIGKNVQINDYVHISAGHLVLIEDNVLIASKVYISDLNHGIYHGLDQSNPWSIVKERDLSYKPVCIKNNVWLGENVAVLPGVTIGANSIIGTNSVVTKNIPDNCIAAGNPATVIKRYNNQTKIWEKV